MTEADVDGWNRSEDVAHNQSLDRAVLTDGGEDVSGGSTADRGGSNSDASPSDAVLPDDLPASKDKFLVWLTECWQCGERTPVVWPKGGHLDGPIGGVLAEHDTPVERVYSKTMGKRVWGNVCQHCDSYQGNFFVQQEAVKLNPPSAECPECGEAHDWRPDQGMGGAFDQGWITCPEYGGEIPVSDPRQ